ncbi:MAG TPA: RNA polymerase sigma factor [Firmicutes bacterium]|nr:RNA polymerase sigma factor [Bacillota bacterium]
MQKKFGRPADRDEEAVGQLVRMHGQMLYRVCLVMLGNPHDAEDAVQETFLRFMTKGPDTKDAEHQKAWLIRTATNLCRNMRLFRLRHPHVDVEAVENLGAPAVCRDVYREVLRLPANYRLVLLLYYVQGYRTEEIARILNISPAAVRKRLQLGREKLRMEWERE